MARKQTPGAKISRPVISGVALRKRLFKLLDNSLRRPVVWVSSPAGSGKTTLITSYLDARKLSCLWYQCDEGDSDPATFFYYLGLAAKKAAPRYKSPLPLLTPEYLAGIPTFTKRYFEKLYNRLTIVVLDNYQEVPADSPFHDILSNGLDIIPDGVHVVVISRCEPPSALARLHANDKISLLEYSDLCFTFEEATELAHVRIPLLDNKYIKAMYEKTEGWAAGITLMLERTRLKGTKPQAAAGFEYERVFDYFAGEVFGKTEKAVQDFLLKTAFMPVLSVPLAEKLTGDGNAGRILSALTRRHYFTQQLSGSGQDYQYHPLFREFLLNRAKTAFSPDVLALIQRKSAQLLEQSGRIEEAARLYRDAGDRDGLSRMVVLHARASWIPMPLGLMSRSALTTA